MTIRLDLRTKPTPLWPYKGLQHRDCFGCADCGQWFDDPHNLTQHECEARRAD